MRETRLYIRNDAPRTAPIINNPEAESGKVPKNIAIIEPSARPKMVPAIMAGFWIKPRREAANEG